MDIMSHPQIQSLIERYGELEKRDRLAVTGLALFLGAIVLYLMVWSPANTFFDTSKVNHERQLSLLQFMRSTESQARTAGGQSSQSLVTSGSLLPTVSRTAQDFDIKPNRLQPEGADGVSVWFNAVRFNDLVSWLESLNMKGISVRQISIDREEEPGTVNARIILRT